MTDPKPVHHPIYGDLFKDPMEDFGGKIVACGLAGGMLGVLIALLLAPQ